MASGSQAGVDGDGDGRSGGKFYKRRRTSVRSTPYDRPTPRQPPIPQPENPNWLTGLVYPAKFVAGGASKLLSSIWNPLTWGSSSSSESDSASEDGVEDGYEDNVNPSYVDAELNQRKGSSSGKSETLHLVEQLLKLERYSREECDRLIEIINSQAVDYSMRDGIDAGPSRILSTTDDETSLDIRNQAIMEAKKLVMKRKLGSYSMTDMDNVINAIEPVMAPHNTEGEANSPVDVAKSYMQTRRPWVSPISYRDSLTPSVVADLVNEGTPYSSTKRDYSSGLWNIQDEIRRLRSKATEDMLSSHQSTKLASYTIEHNFSEHSLAKDKPLEAMQHNEPISVEAPKSADETVNPAVDGGNPDLSDMRTTQDKFPNETLSSITMLVQEHSQVKDSIQMVVVKDADRHKIHPDEEQNARQSKETNPEQEKTTNGDIEGNCELLTASLEVPDVNETLGTVNGSQDSSKTISPTVVQKADSRMENRPVTRASRPSRRGKGRGK